MILDAPADPDAPDPLWVFGYGSLMWHPNIAYTEAVPARVQGYHRALCVRAWRLRGSPERPGLVVGLDRGGACRGWAFRVPPEARAETIAHLHERELKTGIYRPHWLAARLDDGRAMRLYGFVVRRHHPQYAGSLDTEEAARLVCQGRGSAGTSLAYLANTVAHLNDLGIPHAALRAVLDRASALCPGNLAA
mgnify:CR=1 FL=1